MNENTRNNVLFVNGKTKMRLISNRLSIQDERQGHGATNNNGTAVNDAQTIAGKSTGTVLAGRLSSYVKRVSYGKAY